MDVGIIGLAGSGRTTVFRALLAHRAPRAGGPAAAIGTIHVQDPRLDALAARFRPKKTTPIEIHLLDLCPSREPSFPTAEFEGMKRMEVLLGVVPAFADRSEAALTRAFQSLLAELCLEDLAAVERRLARAPREKLEPLEAEALETVRRTLEEERPVRNAPLSAAARGALRGYALITDRPLIAVLNQAEAAVTQGLPEPLVQHAEALGIPMLTLCAPLEAELAELPAEERPAFLSEYGIREPAGAAVTRAILDAADIVPFFTVSEDECRAWPVARGTAAREAAGKIHSDLQRGFIRAEVIAFDALSALPGGLSEAKRAGKLRVEGKDYIVQDGDVVQIRFNV